MKQRFSHGTRLALVAGQIFEDSGGDIFIVVKSSRIQTDVCAIILMLDSECAGELIQMDYYAHWSWKRLDEP